MSALSQRDRTPYDPLARQFASALILLWGIEGGECPHGVGLTAECHEDGCHWNELRPIIRKAARVVGPSGDSVS